MSDPIYDHYQKEEKVINDLTFDHVTTFYHGYPETAVKDINFAALGSGADRQPLD